MVVSTPNGEVGATVQFASSDITSSNGTNELQVITTINLWVSVIVNTAFFPVNYEDQAPPIILTDTYE
jgi:hypothetical protein